MLKHNCEDEKWNQNRNQALNLYLKKQPSYKTKQKTANKWQNPEIKRFNSM